MTATVIKKCLKRKMTQEDRDARLIFIRREIMRDTSKKDIATKLGLSVPGLESWLVAQGTPWGKLTGHEPADLWTPEEDAAMIQHFKSGHSRAVIAGLVSLEFGTGRTRDAVTGRLHRLGAVRRLPKVNNNGASEETLLRRRQDAALRLKQELGGIACPPDAVAFEDLRRGMCRFPYGAVAPFKFCGKPIARGSYCAECEAKVLRPEEG